MRQSGGQDFAPCWILWRSSKCGCPCSRPLCLSVRILSRMFAKVNIFTNIFVKLFLYFTNIKNSSFTGVHKGTLLRTLARREKENAHAACTSVLYQKNEFVFQFFPKYPPVLTLYIISIRVALIAKEIIWGSGFILASVVFTHAPVFFTCGFCSFYIVVGGNR